jgi:hypothetical protein
MQAVYWIGEKSESVLGEASFYHMEEFSVTDATHYHRIRFLAPVLIQTTSNRKEMFLDELILKYGMRREPSVDLINSVAAAERTHRSLTYLFELAPRYAELYFAFHIYEKHVMKHRDSPCTSTCLGAS